MLRPGAPTGSDIDMAAVDQRIAEVRAESEEQFQNVRGMIHKRDPRLDDAEAKANAAVEKYDTLEELAASYAQALPASIADRESLHAEDAALRMAVATLAQRLDNIVTTPGPPGASAYDLARANGYGGTLTQWLASLKGADGQSVKGDPGSPGNDGAPGTPADMARVAALETAVASLQALKVRVAFGTANLPASLAAGATAVVTVNLSPDLGATTYAIGTSLSGGTSLLGQLVLDGEVQGARTSKSVQMRVRNAGLTALLNLSTAVVYVIAAREA